MGGGSADCLEGNKDGVGVAQSNELTMASSTGVRAKKVSVGIQEDHDESSPTTRSQSAHDLDCNGVSSNGSSAACRSLTCNGTSSHRTTDVPWNHDDYVRILMQALDDLGYTSTVAHLEAESGLRLREDPAARLQSAVLNGDWPLAEKLLNSLSLPADACNRWRLALRRERYLELLHAQRPDDALAHLRTEIAPLAAPRADLQALTCLLLARSPAALCRQAGWAGPGRAAREALWEALCGLLPPSVLVPARRMEALLRQALRYQEEQ
jgi:hypothetical protein